MKRKVRERSRCEFKQRQRLAGGNRSLVVPFPGADVPEEETNSTFQEVNPRETHHKRKSRRGLSLRHLKDVRGNGVLQLLFGPITKQRRRPLVRRPRVTEVGHIDIAELVSLPDSSGGLSEI